MKLKPFDRISRAHPGPSASALIVLMLTFAGLLAGCTEPATPARDSVRVDGQTMGTSWSVQVVGERPDTTVLTREIDHLLQQVLDVMSHYQADSQLSRFNAASDQTQWRPVSEQLVQVLEAARKVSELSGGAFDVTAAPLVALWGFGPGAGGPNPAPTRQPAPQPQAIADTLERVGFDKLRLRFEPPAIAAAQTPLRLDLSAIAKGFAVDLIASHLQGRGHQHFLVEIGGEVRAHGFNTQGAKWRLAVEQPLADSRLPLTVLHITDGAVATSGDYRNFHQLADGRRVTHLIDPRTGHPVTHALRSVTVLAPSCARADALATALAVLGPEQGLALAQKARIPALFLVESEAGQLRQHASDALNDFIAR